MGILQCLIVVGWIVLILLSHFQGDFIFEGVVLLFFIKVKINLVIIALINLNKGVNNLIFFITFNNN